MNANSKTQASLKESWKDDEANAPGAAFDEARVLHQLKHYLPAQATLKDFVHHNSLHAFQDKEFFEAIFSASKIFGIRVTFNLNEYRKLYRTGRIRPEILDYVIRNRHGEAHLAEYQQKMLEAQYETRYAPRVGEVRTQWKGVYRINIDDRVQPLLFRILNSYLDQGIALWHFPFEDKGLIQAVRTLEANSFVSFFKKKRAKALLFDPELSLEKLLQIVVGKPAFYEAYLYDQQFAHRGWSGMVSTLEDQPESLLYRKNIALKDVILLELLLEIDALDRELGPRWQPLAMHLETAPPDYFAPVPLGEAEEVLQLWQTAFEWDYYDEVLSALHHVAKTKRALPPVHKTFQAVFCIDDREGSLRRHLEHRDPNCETLGAPGFFGAAFYFQPYGGKFYEKNAPVSATPRHLVKEVEVPEARGQELLHSKHSHTFFRGFLASLSLGLWASLRMIGDLIRPRKKPDMADPFSHMHARGRLLMENPPHKPLENGLQVGFKPQEMADIVENLFRGIGLVADFAPLVYIVGHGSSSANNPHHGAYDCGACSGRPGAVNARVVAFMANHPRVRLILSGRGLHLPQTTHFLGAMHDTSSDEISFFDEETLPASHAPLHTANRETFERALDQNAKERARRFASIDTRRDIRHIRRAIKNRSVSYFEPRPELGHGTNALCYVGARIKLRGLFLDRRAFLNSYDYRTDPAGERLRQVMAPLPMVCGGINLEYFFSRMDNARMGAGTKLSHNVMGLIGVANSSDGDLRPGLPQQMIEVHDPVRLLMMIEHHPEVVLEVIRTTPGLYDWFAKGWLHLVAFAPETGEVYYFEDGRFRPYEPLTPVLQTTDMAGVIETRPMMASGDIMDATEENIPVHIYPTNPE